MLQVWNTASCQQGDSSCSRSIHSCCNKLRRDKLLWLGNFLATSSSITWDSDHKWLPTVYTPFSVPRRQTCAHNRRNANCNYSHFRAPEGLDRTPPPQWGLDCHAPFSSQVPYNPYGHPDLEAVPPPPRVETAWSRRELAKKSVSRTWEPETWIHTGHWLVPLWLL